MRRQWHAQVSVLGLVAHVGAAQRGIGLGDRVDAAASKCPAIVGAEGTIGGKLAAQEATASTMLREALVMQSAPDFAANMLRSAGSVIL